jgi:hypothetical protein
MSNKTFTSSSSEKLIARINKARAIRKTKNGFSISMNSALRLNSFEQILIQHSLRQASDLGAQDLLGNHAKSIPFRITSAVDDNKELQRVASMYRTAAKKLTALRIVFSETTIAYHWWGADLELTDRAAEALEDLVDPGMSVVLAAMFSSRTAGIILLVLKGFGTGLKIEIKKTRSAKGVRIVLYFYVYPVPEERP